MVATGHLQTFPSGQARSVLLLEADMISLDGHVGLGQNRTFVAGFLTSNARHAERSNDRCPVLPHRPRLSRSTASAGSPTMISWAHLAQPPEWLVAFWPIAFFERMPTSWCGQSSTGRRCGIVG